jgi:hypothetical protein
MCGLDGKIIMTLEPPSDSFKLARGEGSIRYNLAGFEPGQPDSIVDPGHDFARCLFVHLDVIDKAAGLPLCLNVLFVLVRPGRQGPRCKDKNNREDHHPDNFLGGILSFHFNPRLLH